MKYLIFTTAQDATNFVIRADQATGYPHNGTAHAIGVEKKFDDTLYAATVATIWAWPAEGNGIPEGGRQYDMENELLTDTERAELKTFQWLVDNNWYPPE